MADINVAATEAQRLGEQEDAIVEKLKDFLISSLKWSFALFGAKDFLMSKQAPFIAISIALIMLFGISSRTTRNDRGTTFINFAFLILGCFVVGITLYSIVRNSYIKWAIYGMFLAMVATNPDYQQFFQRMKRIVKSMCGTTSLRLRNLVIQSKVFIKNLLKINDTDREESSMNNNFATPPVGGNGGRVGEDIV